APRIRNGDVIAATRSIRGLDMAHTGFAIWIDGRLHFMNALLVGSSVEISELPLADRIRRISGQDGITVVRPLKPPAAAARRHGPLHRRLLDRFADLWDHV